MIDRLEHWRAPENSTIPDFIICGAAKAGTTTLHSILDEHPDVFIPKQEIHFFDIDNIIQHGAFNFYNEKSEKWITQDMNSDYEKMWNWYSSHFKNAGNLIIGEDSTTYLASRIAAKRISIQDKKPKLIFMLRHPTKRAYSQYYHMLRTGRAAYSFEDTIRFYPYTVLQWSMYLEQLENYFQFIPSEQIKVVIFENFLKNKKAVVEDVCRFLGIDFNLLPGYALDFHRNQARLPKYPTLQILKNRYLRKTGSMQYKSFLPNTPEIKYKRNLPHVLSKIHDAVNRQSKTIPPEMKLSTKKLLDNFFMNELDGLNELLGEDVLSYWFKDESNTG
jgi:hypothetical protein